MSGRQFILGLAPKLVVDLFAGGGGASTGIEQAIGRHVDIAVNHDPVAVSLHQANHPQTKHFVSDVFEVDPLVVTEGRAIGLLWASPDCKHFSKAKGSKPVSKKVRGLAWVVVKWVRALKPTNCHPDVIFLENVEEFQGWGPLTEAGMPCPERKGQTFLRWKKQLENLGYVIEHRELRGCDYGAPTIRKRLFLVARRDGLPIVWPTPTHADPAKITAGSKLRPWRTAAECIDWDLPCPSIFLTPEEGKALGVRRPLADASMRRIAHGVVRHVIESARPFIVPVTHTGTGDARSHSIDAPLRTITTARRGEFALVSPTLFDSAHSAVSPSGVKRWGKGHRSVGEPLPTVTASGGNPALACATLIQTGFGERPGQTPRAPGVDKPLGTVMAGGCKHAVVAAFLAQHNTGNVGHPATEPVSTVVGGGPTQGVVTAHLSHFYSSNTAGGQGDVRQPIKTILTANHAAVVHAFLCKYYGTDQDPRLEDPLHTVTTKGRFALVKVEGEPFYIADIGMRMLQPRELYRAQGFPESYIIDRGGDGVPLTKDAQIRLVGNSVCPPMSRAIVLANYTEFAMQVAA